MGYCCQIREPCCDLNITDESYKYYLHEIGTNPINLFSDDINFHMLDSAASDLMYMHIKIA